jgi:tellurite resistance protein TerC
MTEAANSFATGPMWAGFIVFVLAMLALDLFVFGGRKAHRVHVREAAAWVAVWVSLALAFAGLLWWYLNGTQGAQVAEKKTLEFLAGYLIEQSLSVDNMFVFVMIFSYFAVPPELQRRVLLYGVLGAIVMRAGMILAGVWLVTQFAWVLYVFGAFLIITGIKMIIFAEAEPDLEKNPLLRWLRGHLRITPHVPRRALLRAAERSPLGDADVPRAGADRGQRPGVRGRQHPGDLRGDHRPLHRVHLEHLRHHGPAGSVLSAG